MAKTQSLIPVERVEQSILLIRGEKVILDSDLARLYKVATKRLNEQVKRNIDRFPEDFMFQLNQKEADSLRSQIATLKKGRGQHRKYLPYVFTEHGALMAANILNSPIAIQGNVQVVRAFIRLRQILASHVTLTRKLNELEKKYDVQFKVVFEAIRQLMIPPETKQKPIGFQVKRKK